MITKEGTQEDPGCSPGKHETGDWRSLPDLLFQGRQRAERQTDFETEIVGPAGQGRAMK